MLPAGLVSFPVFMASFRARACVLIRSQKAAERDGSRVPAPGHTSLFITMVSTRIKAVRQYHKGRLRETPQSPIWRKPEKSRHRIVHAVCQSLLASLGKLRLGNSATKLECGKSSRPITQRPGNKELN